MGFHVQEKSITNGIWVIPHRYHFEGSPRSDRVSDLVAAIYATADKRTLSFAQHLRIVTDDGDPVARYKVWPGRVERLRRRY